MNDCVRLPAEWEPQDGVMLTWPHDGGDWGPYLHLVEPVFVSIAAEIIKREQLLVVCRDRSHQQHIQSLLATANIHNTAVRFFLVQSNDTWARDHGPVTVERDGKLQLCDFTFDGWGGKYPAALDNRITASLHRQGAFAGLPLQSIPLVLEGGAIETDGQGTLLASRSCLLDPVRNPGITQAHMEKELMQTLGIEHFLWLDHGALAGDDTDGHIDTLARFCDADTIVYQSCDNEWDSNYRELKLMEQELRGLKNREGTPYHLVALPSPTSILDSDGDQLPASYANFLIINGAVLVPVYDDPADDMVLERLADCFPGRVMVPVNCRPLIFQYGSLHCVTMQLPCGTLPY